MPSSIFISYRRADSTAEARGLTDILQSTFGARSTFLDQRTLVAGEKWAPAIDRALIVAKVVLVLIGPEWFSAATGPYGKRRLEERGDIVRREISTALRIRETKVVVVLVRGGALPPKQDLPRNIARLWELDPVSLDSLEPTSEGMVKLLKAVRLGGVRPPRRIAGPATAVSFAAITTDQLQAALCSSLSQWKCASNSGSPSPKRPRRELRRILRFASFQAALRFMSEIAPVCELRSHHPTWSNRWREVRVRLTTWRNDYDLSSLDLEMALEIESLYMSSYQA